MGERLLTSTNIPAWARHAKWDDYEYTDVLGERRIKKIREWDPTLRKPGLLLSGPPGVGKTMLAAATLNEFQHRHVDIRRNLPEDAWSVIAQGRYPVYFIQLAEFIQLHIRLFRLTDDVRAGLRAPDEYLGIDGLLQDLVTKVKMLVIDDVGKEHRTSSGFAEDEFDLLVRTRHNRGLATIFTTNTPLNRWSDQYSAAMRNFMERSCLSLKF